MMLRSGGVCFIVCVIFAVSLTASASDGSEIFVVPANINGAASYLVSNGDGTFSSQQSQQSLESASAGVAVYLGNGNGTFTYLNTYRDESNEQLRSVTAAPFVLNKEPVAAVESAYPDVSVGEAISP